MFTVDGIYGSFRANIGPPYGIIAIPTSVNGTMTVEGATVDVPATLPRAVTVTGRVLGTNGQAVPYASLEFISGALFAKYPSVDANGNYTVVAPADVPILVTAYDYNVPARAGVREITLPGTSSTATLDLVLDGAYLPKTLTDVNGYPFTVVQRGLVNENQFQNAFNERFGFAATYSSGCVPDRLLECGRDRAQRRAVADPHAKRHRGWPVPCRAGSTCPPAATSSATSTRSRTAARTPITLSAVLTGWNRQAAPMLMTSDGDTTVTTADQWVVGGFSNPRASHVFAGTGGVAPSTAVVDAGNVLTYTWSNLTVQPGQRIALLHFGGQHRDQAAAEGAARRLVQLPPEALDGIEPGERDAIINFDVPAVSALDPLDVTVSGVVTLDSVQVVPNAQVTLTAPNPFVNAPKTTTANALGEYSLAYPVADAYTLTAFDPVTTATSPLVTGTRSAGQSAITANISFAGVGSNIVRGTVIREGQGVAGATVRLQRSYPAVDRTTIASATGTFQFNGVGEGWWTIEATSAFGSTPLAYFYVQGEGATIQRDVHYLTRGGTLTVDVFAADGTTRLGDVEVDVYDRGTEQLIAALGGANVGGAAPQFRFDNLLHSSAGLRVVAYNQSRSDVKVETLSGFAAAGTGQAATASLTLPVAVLSGTFYLADGVTPVAFASVRASQVAANGSLVSFYTRSDAAGGYRLSGLVPGTVWLRGEGRGGGPEGSSGLLAAEVESSMPASPGNATVNLVLPPSARIAGVVRSANGTAIASIYVGLVSNGGPLDQYVFVQAGADGSFAFEQVPLGGFTLQTCDYTVETVCAGASGFVTAPDTTVVADITFAARSPVEVVVSADEAGLQPIANASVALSSGQMGPGDSAFTYRSTDALGKALFADVQRGPVVAVFSDYATRSALNVGVVGAAPLVLPLVVSATATPNFQANVTEVSGLTTVIDCNGQLRGDSEGGSGLPPFNQALTLQVNGNAAGCLPVRFGTPSAEGVTRLDYGPWLTGGLMVTRHLTHVTSSSAIGYLERFQNTTAASITVDVDIATRLSDPVQVLTPAATVGDRYQIVSAPDRAIFGDVFAGIDAGLLKPSLVRVQNPGGHSTVRFRLTIPPNDYRVIAHFAFTRPALPGAAAQADATASAISAGTDVSVVVPLQVDPAKVVNFRLEIP